MWLLVHCADFSDCGSRASDELLDHLRHGGVADDRAEVLRVLGGHGGEGFCGRQIPCSEVVFHGGDKGQPSFVREVPGGDEGVAFVGFGSRIKTGTSSGGVTAGLGSMRLRRMFQCDSPAGGGPFFLHRRCFSVKGPDLLLRRAASPGF